MRRTGSGLRDLPTGDRLSLSAGSLLVLRMGSDQDVERDVESRLQHWVEQKKENL